MSKCGVKLSRTKLKVHTDVLLFFDYPGMARVVCRTLSLVAKRQGRNFDVLWLIFPTSTTTLEARLVTFYLSCHCYLLVSLTYLIKMFAIMQL